ncbi:MAG TPA: hypothetical protein VFM64_01825 [Candidatus Nitrosotenuis sp.]|nr:hypothetical protein [Candidatus Nitrosotenuis sp.]
MKNMDARLEEKIKEKIQESLENISEIHHLAETIGVKGDVRAFKYGIVVGRLYNSFYYQSRRVMKRDPTKDEFLEFLGILQRNEKLILESI